MVFNSVYKKNNNIVTAEFESNKSVLFNVEDRTSHILNSTAQEVYRLTDGKKTMEQISDIIAESFQADKQVVQKDVKHICHLFIKKGIIHHHG